MLPPVFESRLEILMLFQNREKLFRKCGFNVVEIGDENRVEEQAGNEGKGAGPCSIHVVFF